ncbi:SLC2A4 regulator [Turdus rufiventris]|nr:SLC2A4 regulator [Turdus rufiventris]
MWAAKVWIYTGVWGVGAATSELRCQEGVRSSPGSVEIPAGSLLMLSQWVMALAAASQRDLESAEELLAGSHCNLAPLGSEGWLGEPPSRRDPASQEAMLRVLDAGLERCLALHSAVQCIPVPRHRKLSGKAGIDEVMAAAVLTSLSASPLVLGHPPATHAPEPSSEVWKEAPAMSSSCSSSSNTSGDWSWDPSSDRSTPSTPSPPLSSHVPSTFLPGPLPDEGPDEPDGTHFVFGEPTPRKRKVGEAGDDDGSEVGNSKNGDDSWDEVGYVNEFGNGDSEDGDEEEDIWGGNEEDGVGDRDDS